MSTTLVAAFDKAYLAMLADPTLRAQVWLTPEEEILVSYEAGTRLPVPIGRLDCSLIHGDSGEPSLKLLEYNAESPAAIAYEDGLAEVFLQTPLLQAFRQRFPLRPLWARPAALQSTSVSTPRPGPISRTWLSDEISASATILRTMLGSMRKF